MLYPKSKDAVQEEFPTSPKLRTGDDSNRSRLVPGWFQGGTKFTPCWLQAGPGLVVEVPAWTWLHVVGRPVMPGALGQRHLRNTLVLGMPCTENAAVKSYATDHHCLAGFSLHPHGVNELLRMHVACDQVQFANPEYAPVDELPTLSQVDEARSDLQDQAMPAEVHDRRAARVDSENLPAVGGIGSGQASADPTRSEEE